MKPIDEPVRDRIRRDLQTSYALAAGAGTGKTTLLVERVLSAYRAGIEPQQLVAITFTEAAAAELKLRIRAKLNNAPEEKLRALADRVLEAPVETIHAFCARLLRDFADCSPWPAGFEILQGQARAEVELEVFEEWLRQGVREKRSECVEILASGLKPATLLRAVRRLACAPWALRHLLQRRAVAGDWERRARESIAELDALAADVRDESDPAYRQILALGLLSSSERFADRFLALAIRARAGAKTRWAKPASLMRAKEIFTALETLQEGWRKERNARLCFGFARWASEYVQRFEELRRARAQAIFEDLLHDVLAMLESDAQMPGRVRERYRALFVDEFQDTDPVQARIFELIGEGLVSRGGVFYVGDWKQSIYRFRSADVGTYRAACEHLAGEKGGAREEIQQNFRTVAPILRWINGLFARLFAQEGYGELVPWRQGPWGPSQAVFLVHPFAPQEDGEALDEARLVAGVLKHLLEEEHEIEDENGCRRRVRPGDIAVLARTRSIFPKIEAVMDELALPYVQESGHEFYQRQEIRSLIAALRAIETPGDEVAVLAALRSALYGISDRELADHHLAGGRFDPALEPPAAAPEAVRAALADLWRRHQRRHLVPLERTLAELIGERAVRCFALLRPSGLRRLENIEKLLALAATFDARRPRVSFGTFVRHIAEQEREARAETEGSLAEAGEERIRLITIHKSKGREFPVVVLANLGAGTQNTRDSVLGRPLRDEGELCLGKGVGNTRVETPGYEEMRAAEKERERSELRRLLYVAVTRARDSLWLIKRGSARRQSPTLLDLLPQGLWEEGAAGAEGVRHVEARTLIAPARSQAAPRLARTRAGEGGGGAWMRERDGDLARWRDTVAALSPAPPPQSPKEGRAQDAAEEERALGEVVHAALERWRPGCDLGDLLDAAAPARARVLCERALCMPLIRVGLEHPEAQREYPFITADGRTGRIDLLYPEGEDWVVVDYKCGVERERDCEQVRFYAQAVAGLLGGARVRAALAYLGSGVVVPVHV